MLTKKQMRIINAHKLPINLNPSKWEVCWEDKDVLEIVNSRHRILCLTAWRKPNNKIK